MDISYAGQKVLIIGAGISGFAAAKVLKKLGAEVVLSDAKAEADIKYDFTELREAGIELVFGPQADSLLDGVDIVLASPAVPVRVPIIQTALQRGLRLMSEIELAYILARSPFCAVTGTNGKTTTVTLLGLLLEAQFDRVGVGGNIGVPLVDEALRVGAGGAVAAEISSYQLEATSLFHPHVAAILNVTPDHIVRHGSMEVYQATKEKIFAQQTAADAVVLNYDDERTRGMAERARRNTRVCFFSRRTELAEGATLVGDRLTLRWEGQEYPLCTVDELGIKGGHNVENALAAAAVAFLAGVEPERMIPVLKSFKGVEHRIEYVRTIDDVPYYNDSKATNTDSAIKALETFPDHIILIAGGDDKLTDLTDFMTLVKARVDELILLGDAAERFAKAALDMGIAAEHIYKVGYDMGAAVAKAHELASKPQVVLLSPACASFDMYDGFEERGRDFKRLVQAL